MSQLKEIRRQNLFKVCTNIETDPQCTTVCSQWAFYFCPGWRLVHDTKRSTCLTDVKKNTADDDAIVVRKQRIYLLFVSQLGKLT